MADFEDVDFKNPHPSIHDLFAYYNLLYFQGELGACSLKWSTKRMTLCAGVCHYSKFGGCDIRLSEPILKFRPVSDVKNTLLHEMIHAYLFLTNGNNDHDDHGPCFQNLMMMINDCHLADEERPEQGYAITVYHKFVDEVELYRVHHWKCTSCADLIKRAMNRTPSVSDCLTRSEACSHTGCHWHMHKKHCGGSYEKIREPPGYVDKRKSTLQATVENIKSGAQSVDNCSGTGPLNGQKRKYIISTGPVAKKNSKDPNFRSLERYFPTVEADDKMTYRETSTIEMDSTCNTGLETGTANLDDEFSTVDMERRDRACTQNSAVEKDSRAGPLEDGKSANLEIEPCAFPLKGGDVDTLKQANAMTKEGTSDKLAEIDVRNIIVSKRISTRSSRVKEIQLPEETVLLMSCKQDRTGIESSGSALVSRRKRIKTSDDSLCHQIYKEPIVILAWANWASYEVDEESEEPLINNRIERKKRAKALELVNMEVKAVSDQSAVKELTAQELHGKTEYGMRVSEECPDEDLPENDCVVIDDPDEDKKAGAKDVLIELSDDECFDGDVFLRKCTEEQTLGHKSRTAEQASTVLKELKPYNPWKDSLMGPIKTQIARKVGGAESLSTVNDVNMKRGCTEKTDQIACPICTLTFRDNERVYVMNKHINDCLLQTV